MTEEIRAMLDAEMTASPFIRFSGMEIAAFDPEGGVLEITMPSRPEFLRNDRDETMIHGGPIAALIDTAGDFAVAMRVGGAVPTISFTVDYFRPARGLLRAVATVRKTGRSICVADVEVIGEDGKVCAIGRGTYSGQIG